MYFHTSLFSGLPRGGRWTTPRRPPAALGHSRPGKVGHASPSRAASLYKDLIYSSLKQ